jgi:hypothetical protein
VYRKIQNLKLIPNCEEKYEKSLIKSYEQGISDKVEINFFFA